MQSGATLELVICCGLVVGPKQASQPRFDAPRQEPEVQDCRCKGIHLLSAVNQTLLCRWDTLLLLNALLYP